MIHLTAADLRRIKRMQSQQSKDVRDIRQSGQRSQVNSAASRTSPCTDGRKMHKSFIRELTLVNGKYVGEDRPMGAEE